MCHNPGGDILLLIFYTLFMCRASSLLPTFQKMEIHNETYVILVYLFLFVWCFFKYFVLTPFFASNAQAWRTRQPICSRHLLTLIGHAAILMMLHEFLLLSGETAWSSSTPLKFNMVLWHQICSNNTHTIHQDWYMYLHEGLPPVVNVGKYIPYTWIIRVP